MRSRTVSAEEDFSGVSSWTKDKLMEQKGKIKAYEDEIEKLKIDNKVQQVCEIF